MKELSGKQRARADSTCQEVRWLSGKYPCRATPALETALRRSTQLPCRTSDYTWLQQWWCDPIRHWHSANNPW